MNVNQLAQLCHEAERLYCQFNGLPPLPQWAFMGDDARSVVVYRVRLVLRGHTSPNQMHQTWVSEQLDTGRCYRLDDRVDPELVEFQYLGLELQTKYTFFIDLVKSLSLVVE